MVEIKTSMTVRGFGDYILRHIPLNLRVQAKAQAKREGYTLRVVMIRLLENYVKRGKES